MQLANSLNGYFIYSTTLGGQIQPNKGLLKGGLLHETEAFKVSFFCR